MKKIAIVVMLLAVSAFAAVDLQVAPVSAKVNAANEVTFNFSLVGANATDKVGGYSLYAVTVPGQLQVAARATTGVISDPSDSAAVGKILEDTGAIDLGYTAAANVFQTADGPVLALTLKSLVPVPASGITVDFYPFLSVAGAAIDGTVQTVTITPEPTSMLLLAAGAAFFARRRRA